MGDKTKQFFISVLLGSLSSASLLFFDPVKLFLDWLKTLFHDMSQGLMNYINTGEYRNLYIIIGIILSAVWGAILNKFLSGKNKKSAVHG